MVSKLLATAMWLLLALSAWAQINHAEIQILDETDKSPIIGVAYQVGEQQGISDSDGKIRFHFELNDELQLSSLDYGNWSLAGEALEYVVQNGVFYRRKLEFSIHPVTVVALRRNAHAPHCSQEVEQNDRLEHDAAAVLNDIPSFNSIRKGGNYGFDVVFRGFKYEQLNIVLNGAQSATAACPNRMDPPTSQMAPNMMERIDVLKGPHALRFGTGFGGTIHFKTESPRFASKIASYGRLNIGYESNGNMPRGEAQLGLRGKWYDFAVFGSWSEGDDYRAGNGELIPADFSRLSIGSNLGLKLSASHHLRFSATHNKAKDADFPALSMDLRNDETWMMHTRHDWILSGKYLQSWNTTLYASWVDHLMDNGLKPLDPRMLNASTQANTQNYGFRSEGVWQWAGNQLFTGIDFRTETASGSRVRDFLMGPMIGQTFIDPVWQDGMIRKTAAFFEYQVNRWSIDWVVSSRLEWNTGELFDPSDEFLLVHPTHQVQDFNPSISFGGVKNWTSQWKTGLWLGRAQRSGSLTERYAHYLPVGQDPYEWLGNPEVLPETNYQADAQLAFTTENFSLTIDLFAAYLQNYISSQIDTALSPRLPTSPGVRSVINLDQAFKTGLEGSVAHQLAASFSHQLQWAYTYAVDLKTQQPLPEIAPFDIRYQVKAFLFSERFSPSIQLRYVANQNRIAADFGETQTPSFITIDLFLAYQWTDQLSLRFGVNNLLDENYYEHLNRSVTAATYPIFAPGRNFVLNLNYRFGQ